MIITYLGGEFVKVQFGDTVLAFNPPSKESKLKATRFGADVALVSINHPDMNGVEQVAHGERQPFTITGPGEYEIKGVVVRGFATESLFGLPAQAGGEKRINTVYTVDLEGMKLCFLGALSSAELPANLKEELDGIDILFIPIGGDGVLTPSLAEKLSVAIEPRLVIPIHFEGMGATGALKQFLKEAGEEKAEAQDKLTIKKKDLEGKEGEVVVLRTNNQ
ncbi:MAG: MBL fold metallo-hydrolase [bacterium]|nr:MBL fold metallo-hydrolase [bacterium]